MPNSTPIPSLPPIPPSNLATQVVQVVVEKFLKIFINRYKSLRIVVLGARRRHQLCRDVFASISRACQNKSESQSIVRMRLKQVTQFTNALVVAFGPLAARTSCQQNYKNFAWSKASCHVESKVKHMNFSPMELAKQKASDSLVGEEQQTRPCSKKTTCLIFQLCQKLKRNPWL